MVWRALAGGLVSLLITHASPAAAMPSDAADDQALGTLFFSPAERLAIERNRSGEAAAADVPPARVQVDGLVRRAHGKSTVWLNNRALPEGQAGMLQQAPSITASGVSIKGASLRVGEALDLSTGQRADLVPQGTVTRKPAR